MDVQRFSVDDLGRLGRAWDAAVDRTPLIDRFCSATDWSFSAATSFPEAGPPVLTGDGSGFCGLRSVRAEDGTEVLVGLDPVWGFASPVVGPPPAAAAAARACLSACRFHHALLTGQREDNPLTAWLVRALDPSHRLLRGPVQERLRIDLSQGWEPWWGRRSGRFRQRMRRTRLQAADQGIEVVDVSALAPDELFDRVLAVESRSWKCAEETGLTSPAMADFYRQLTARLARREGVRALFARLADHDVGYILGGVRSGTYRGLQLSYDQEVAALGIGHLLQLEQVERAAVEGVALYDLGMDMPYKRRWADQVDETFSIVVVP